MSTDVNQILKTLADMEGPLANQHLHQTEARIAISALCSSLDNCDTALANAVFNFAGRCSLPFLRLLAQKQILPTDAMSLGFQKSTGRWIADSDDYAGDMKFFNQLESLTAK